MNIRSKREVKNDNNILKTNAHQKPLIVIPSVKESAKRIIKALITREKKPNVINVIGKENKEIIGLIETFNKPKTIAKIRADEK